MGTNAKNGWSPEEHDLARIFDTEEWRRRQRAAESFEELRITARKLAWRRELAERTIAGEDPLRPLRERREGELSRRAAGMVGTMEAGDAVGP